MDKRKKHPQNRSNEEDGIYKFTLSKRVFSFYKIYTAYIRVSYERADYQRIKLFLN